MEFFSEYGMFLAKTITIAIVILGGVAVIVALVAKGKGAAAGRLKVRDLNRRYAETENALKVAMLPKKLVKQAAKEAKRARKAKDKLAEKGTPHRRRLFVLDFHGDIRASAVASLREEVSAVLTVAAPGDEVLVRLESPGGMVPSYGLAASQLVRIKNHSIPLTVTVDKMAASGGYMMACVADRIVCAPFAVVGSIGVVSQLPNFNRLLKRNDVDYEMFTAGEFKRTVTVLGENTEAGRQKYQAEIEDIHDLFKTFVKQHRPQVDLDRVATGEHWFGTRALEWKLVDEIGTSDDFLMAAHDAADLYQVSYEAKKPWLSRLTEQVRAAVDGQAADRPPGPLMRHTD
jgi:serine protease SohB